MDGNGTSGPSVHAMVYAAAEEAWSLEADLHSADADGDCSAEDDREALLGVPATPRASFWEPALRPLHSTWMRVPATLRRDLVPQARSRSLAAALEEVGFSAPEECRQGHGDNSLWSCRRGLAGAAAAASLVAVGLTLLHRRREPGAPSGGMEVGSSSLSADATDLALTCVKVACVGASITKGSVQVLGGELASEKPYPAHLQELLGAGYCTRNFGAPDATVLKKSRMPYWTHGPMKEINEYAPDIVIIQFGANDSREKNFDRDFGGDYTSMIHLFRKLKSRPRVYMMAMPPIYSGTATLDGIPGKRYGMDRDKVNGLGIPLDAVAKDNSLPPPIAVLEMFKEHCPDLNAACDWMSEDGVHPNTRGDAAMARLVLLTIKGDDRCTARPEEKDRCGPAEVSLTQCKDIDCCWGPEKLRGVPQCFRKSAFVEATEQDCAAPHDEKTDCGFIGVTDKQCKAKGCCYSESLDGTPWCFHKLQPLATPVPGTTTITTTRTWTTSTSTSSRTTLPPPCSLGAPTSCVDQAGNTSLQWGGAAVGAAGRIGSAATYEVSSFFQFLWSNILCIILVLIFGLLLVLSLCLCDRWYRKAQALGREKEREMDMQYPEYKEYQPGMEADEQRQHDEEQRQLRRLEVDLALRSVERTRARVEEDRRQRQLESFMISHGFKDMNEPKVVRESCVPMWRKPAFTYPLHVATEENRPEIVELLVWAKADVNLTDSKKRSPLALAQQLQQINKKENPSKLDSHAKVTEALQLGASIAADANGRGT